MTLLAKTKNGIMWSLTDQLLSKGVTALSTLLLTYFLSPKDFGLLAMIAVFIAVATTIMESGVKEALIRTDKLENLELSTAFLFNVGTGALIYALMYFSATYVASYYNEEKLIDLMRVLSLTVVIYSFQGVQVAVFSKQLNFKAQLQSSIPAVIISGVLGILLAYYNFGVWALVFQILIQAIISTLLLWIQSSWRPSLLFSIKSFKYIYSFGSKLIISNLIGILSKNLLNIILAKSFGSAVVGLYYIADRILVLLMSQLVYAVQNVTYPTFSSIKDDDLRLNEACRIVIKAVTFVVFPILLISSTLAESIFILFFKSDWFGGAAYYQIMSLNFLFYPLHAINLNILKVKGRSDIFLKLEIYKFILMLIILFFTLPHGVEIVLWGQVIGSIASYFINAHYSNSLINYSITRQIRDFLPSLLISLTICFLLKLSLLLKFDNLFNVFGLGSLALILYFIISKLMSLDSYKIVNNFLRIK